jgi:hypothetical protein
MTDTSRETLAGDSSDPRAIWDQVRREGQAAERLSDKALASPVLRQVILGDGLSLWGGLDAHDPNVSVLINDSIKTLEARIDKQRNP